ncbi:hypothetical protein [Dethiobacter alkaliphilus]|uniref:Uncharacterized protein n=1 Tax=Dethiobacter alkaliphilus AHT 1 TaxID=555088 RepID=C0GHQ6_DETAL|nr:hypothetical protein [Dethiobacter alkaliphilus]EEG77262.1 hypothetical protein DealDRAFT_2015 [Dethiobacter alkaliphilus AHT 1]
MFVSKPSAVHIVYVFFLLLMLFYFSVSLYYVIKDGFYFAVASAIVTLYLIITTVLDIFSSIYSVSFEADQLIYSNLFTTKTIAYREITGVYKIKTPLCHGHHITLKICSNNNLPIFLSLKELESARERSALLSRIKSKTKLQLIQKKNRFIY